MVLSINASRSVVHSSKHRTFPSPGPYPGLEYPPSLRYTSGLVLTCTHDFQTLVDSTAGAQLGHHHQVMAFTTAMYVSGDPLPDTSNGTTQLPTIKTPFNIEASKQVNRPRPALRDLEYNSGYHGDKRDSIKSDATPLRITKRSSRFGLSALFSRSRSTEAEKQCEDLGTQYEEEEHGETLMGQGTRALAPSEGTPTSEQYSALPHIDGPSTPLRHRTSKAALRSKSSLKNESSTKFNAPPLFQAYPQAVKYAVLHVPTMSAEAILRLSIAKTKAEGHSNDTCVSEPDPVKGPKKEKSKRPTTADSLVTRGEWTEKIFVLITSGYILQYLGHGTFDRLPEKIMPLNKDSAAFASDAIPGKPYVLQISQVSEDEGRVDIDTSRSMFKKLGLRSETRRSTSCLLLVLENPDDLSSWLRTVRKEIQAVGGKEYIPDEFHRPATGDSPQKLQQRPSQRYLVKRDPLRFSDMPTNPPTHIQVSAGADLESMTEADVETPIPFVAHRQSMATSTSTESQFLSNTTASINQTHLDRLRETPRQSYASTDVRTLATSRDSSPLVSPMKSMFDSQDDSAMKSKDAFQLSKTQSPLHQFAEQTPKHTQASSPAAAPNFSVPISNRYSSAASSPSPAPSTSKAYSSPIHLRTDPASPGTINEESEAGKEPATAIGELHSRRKASPHIAKYFPSPELPLALTPPASSGSQDFTSPAEGEMLSTRRLSSVPYTRRGSQIHLARSTPSPHPPPTSALPAIPGSTSSHRTSLLPRPTTPLPAIPSTRPRNRYSMMPQPSKSDATHAAKRPSSSSAADSPWLTPVSTQTIGNLQPISNSDRPSGIQRSSTAPNNPTTQASLTSQPVKDGMSASSIPPRGLVTPPSEERDFSNLANDLTPPPPPPETKPAMMLGSSSQAKELTFALDRTETPPGSKGAPSRPPTSTSTSTISSTRPPLGFRRSVHAVPRIGREPPPVPSPIERSRNRISTISPAENYFDAPAPHPFIPPIRVSERKFRGSIDGPWNPGYLGGGKAPLRMFGDLSAR